MSATVVCPVVAEDAALESTVGLAADLAARHDAVLSLVDVDPPVEHLAVPVAAPALPLEAHGAEDGPLGGQLAEAARARRAALADAARRAGCSAVVCESLHAMPREAVARLSARPGTELLVVHDRGGGALRSVLLGNAGREAMRDVRCPVVLAPAEVGGPLPEAPTIVCAVDDDEVAPTVAAFAGHLAEVLGVPLHVMHAGDAGAPLRIERLFDRLRGVVPAGVPTSWTALPGPAAEELSAEAAGMDADLIVVGRPGHGPLAAAFTGSVAHHLAEHGGAPVVVVPDALHLTAR